MMLLCGACSGDEARVPDHREDGPVEERCLREVEELHRFFAEWFRGELPDDDASFQRFAGVLTPSFEIHPPDGGVLERGEILARVRGAHGAHAQDGFDIRIENAAARWLGDGMLEATYEEWQTEGGESRGRRSRALMRQNAGAPNGVDWVRVEETWIE